MGDMCKRSSKFSGIVLLLIGDLIRLGTLFDRVLSMHYRGSIFRYFQATWIVRVSYCHQV